MLKQIPVGIIGLGRLGVKHAINIQSNSKAKLVAIADSESSFSETVFNRFSGIRIYKNYLELLKDSELKAVIIVTPTKTHYQISIDAINAGKYVFCEKPIAFTLEEAKKIYKLVEKKRAFYQLGFMRRFDPGYKAAKNKIMNGVIGEPVYFKGTSRDPDVPAKGFIPGSGGLIFDMCIHDIDLSRWFLGEEAVEVFAQGGVLIHKFLKDFDDIDQTNLIIKFANDKMAAIDGSRNAGFGYDVRAEIIGEKGIVMIGQYKSKPFVVYNTNGERSEELISDFLARFKDAFVLEIENFIEKILKDEEPEITAYDGYMSNMIADAAQKSFKKNIPVKL